MNASVHRAIGNALGRLRRAVGWRSTRARAAGELPADLDAQSRQIIEAVNAYTMTSPERVHAAIEAVRYVVANGIAGAIVECGVWKGGSTMAMAMALDALGERDRDLYLYDTFAGMSAPSDADVSISGKPAAAKFEARRTGEDSSRWCLSPLDEVRANLGRTGYPRERFHLVEGKVENTLPAHSPPAPIAVLRLDTDWYESTRHELVHLYPLLARRGVLIIDDYGHWQGARKAVDEYMAEHGLCLLLSRIDDTGRMAVKP